MQNNGNHIETFRNGASRTSKRGHPTPTCHVCGEKIDLHRDHPVRMESISDALTHTEIFVWHQDCYDRYLEEGEEC